MSERPLSRWVTIIAVVVVGIVIVVGLSLMDRPSVARAKRLDQRRLDELVDVSRAVEGYWGRYRRLPAGLDSLLAEPGMVLSSKDPVSGASYEYRLLGDRRYQLCAVFATTSPGEPRFEPTKLWAHGVGHQCFELTVREPEH